MLTSLRLTMGLFVVLVTLATSGLATAQSNAGQKTASPAQTAQKTTAAKPAPTFIPMPEDIQCSFQGVEFRQIVGSNAMNGSVEAVTCYPTKSPEQKKDVPLVSGKITDGTLSTKDFGDFKLNASNNLYSNAIAIAIRNDNVQPLRKFLAPGASPTPPAPAKQ
ncbi:MAG: hypothetical protein ABSD31_10380 [Candidatus Binataceae bacterium]|jgi:hypothetical protein